MTLQQRMGEAPRVAIERGWLDISWTGRSLIAAAFLAVCMLLSALSATASVRRADAVREARAEAADQQALAADFRAYLARQSAAAERPFDGPRLKPARSTENVVAEHGAIADLVDFDFDDLTLAHIDAKERDCLAQAIYYEARSEPRIGQLAVADVVLNRVASPLFPNSVCAVVFQGADRRIGCQFTFTCDGAMKMAVNRRKWRQSQDLAGAILAGLREPVSRQATHYHATYVSPPWSKTLTPTAVIGSHKFYRFPNRTQLASAAPSAAE